VLGKLTGEDEANGSLDLTGGDGGLLVVSGKLGSLGRNTLENIIDERVENGHRTVGDTSVRVNLLQNLVDVGRVGLLPGLGTLLLLTAGSGSLLASILLLRSGLSGRSLSSDGGLLLGGLGGHFD